MNQASLLAGVIKSGCEMIPWHLGDFSDGDMMVRPVAEGNHTAWQLAHLAGFEITVITALGGTVPGDLPPALESARAKGASKIDDPATFPSKNEFLTLLAATQAAILAAIASKPDEHFSQPSPGSLKDFAPTLADLVAMVPMHAAMHLGQIQVIRRKLGKPHLF